MSAQRSLIVACAALLLGSTVYLAITRIAGDPVRHHDWVDEGTHRWAPLELRASGTPGFERMDNGPLGIDFRNTLEEARIVENRNLLNGSGVALGDVTGNGFADIYLARLDGPNRLYENRGGWRFRDITEEAGVGLPDQHSTGALLADLNGDGHLDLAVSAIGAPNRVFLNDGHGRFSELEGALEADRTYGSVSLAAADVTGNGALDLYVVNYKERSVRDIWPYEQEFRFIVEEVEGEFRIRERYREHYRLDFRASAILWFEEGEPDLLFLNDGRGRFTRVPLDSGVLLDEDGRPVREPLRDWGLHAQFQDLDGDGRPDLYVANDFESPDRIWLNRGDGTFRAAPWLAVRKSSLSSMAVDFSDIDRDGHVDFLVVEMLSRDHEKRLRQMSTMAPSPQPIGAIADRPQYMGNTLFLNRGDGTWAEVAEHAGIRRSDWSWGALFVDLDLDGFEDALITTGHHFDVQDADANQLVRSRMEMGQLDMERVMLLYPPLAEPNAIFRNRADGTFEDVTERWGFTDEDVSHGMALADLDNSGYLDLVVNRLEHEPAIFRNTAAAARVQVRLRGAPPNTRGIGATIRFLGGPVPQSKEVVAGGSYLSSSDRTYVFAAGASPGPFRIEVEWPSGARSDIGDVRPDRIYEIREEGEAGLRAVADPPSSRPVGSAAGDDDGGVGGADGAVAGADDEAFSPAAAAPDLPFFEDYTDRLGHRHHENAYPDFARQPLLPYRLSRLGPGVAWIDVDGDGLDDLFVGSGAGSGPAWFRNLGEGRFQRVEGGALATAAGQDQGGLAGWWEDGVPHLLVGSANYETGDAQAESGARFRLAGGGARIPGVAGAPASTGPVAMADYTGNGYLDLFVGGRVVRDRYPSPASSRLFRNEGGGRFVLDEAGSERLDEFGMVTGAVFSDLDGDGTPELVLARSWGSIVVLAFRAGAVVDVTEELGIAARFGWWTGVATGDLDGNGRLDIVAGNLGTNNPWAALSSPERPARIRYGDLDGDGFVELLETYHDVGMGAEVPRRGLGPVAEEFAFVGDRMGSHDAYARSSVDEIVGGRLIEMSSVEAGHFEHTIFWNRPSGFEAEPLPTEAQWSPAFHVAVADLSGDGSEDIFLSQNFFSYRDETPRSDAGRGLWLRGDGRGGFTPVPGHESGILVWGEQRGAALSDFDGDGRLDLAVTQNGAATRLFRNRGAEPGLRVRLRGTAANPRGVGAQLRLVYPDAGQGPREGPVREVQAGSGYWSQNSPTQILGMLRTPEALRVRWPSGEERLYPLPPDAGEVEAGVDGELVVLRVRGEGR